MKVNANRRLHLVLLAALVVLSSAIHAAADPCCIIVVPPTPPPQPTPASGGASLPPLDGWLYAQLPLFAAMEKKAFGQLNVKIDSMPLNDALRTVASAQGYLGIGPVNILAVYNAKTGAKLQIGAVMINRSQYALYALEGGPSKLDALKGKKIAVPSIGSLAHLFTIRALQSVGLNEKDVTIVAIATAPERLANLTKGDLDAAALLMGTESAEPKLKQLATPKPIALPSWVLYASSVTLEKETKEVRQFLASLTEGMKIVKTDHELTRRILEERFKVADRKMQDVIVGKYIPLILPDSIKPDPKEVEQLANTLHSIGQVDTTPVLLDLRNVEQLF